MDGHRVKVFTVPGTAVAGAERDVFLFRTTDQGQLAVLETDVVRHSPPNLSARRSRTSPLSLDERHVLTEVPGGCRYVVSFESKVPIGFTRKVGQTLQRDLDEYVARIEALVGAALPQSESAALADER